MSAERWKRQERAIAAALGGVRLPNSGRSQPDVRAPGLAAQVKTRGALPGWLWSAVDQSQRDAGPDETAVVVLAEVAPGRKTKRLVVLDFDRFVALVAGGATTQNDPEPGAVAGAAMSQNDTETGTGRAPPAPPTTARRPPA